MTNFYRTVSAFFIGSISFLYQTAAAQSVLNPGDPVRDTTANLSQPPWGQIGKWMRTKKMGWNTDSYKAYIYKGRQFRLKFPKTYNPSVADGKKYPVYVFFHGLGEKGGIKDNETQLLNGGLRFLQAVDNGVFDGYLLYMQSEGFFGPTEYQLITEILDYMVPNNKLDPFRIYINGLSAGGQATWDMAVNFPKYVSCAIPMSAASILYLNGNATNAARYTPMWLFQGGKDGDPAPATAHQVRDFFVQAGADLKYTEYKTFAHNTWDSAWLEPDFIPFMLRAYSSNPWPLFGKTQLHQGDPADTIGLAPGYDSYQWRKNGILIQEAHLNYIAVKDSGIYDARVLSGSLWSDWSHVPVIIKGSALSPLSATKASPNPFRSYFDLTVKVDGNNKSLLLMLYDLNGKTVANKKYDHLTNGINNIHVQSEGNIPNGTYVLKIIVDGAPDAGVIKLIKQ